MIGLLPRVLRFAAICATTLFFILVIINTNPSANNETVSSVDEEAALIDSALYTRVEFFGSQAYVPYPTAEARNRLSDLQTKYPNRPEVYLRLAQFDEKLGREEDALKNMRAFVEHEPDKMKGLTGLAQYFHRRAQFAAEGETLERMLDIAPQDRRTAIFRDLLQLAETHLLEKYLSPAFLNQTVEKNPDTFEIVNHYIDRLTEQKNFQQALNLVRQYKAKFPEQTDVTLEMEVSLLDHLHRTKEAEAIYHAAFDPFWTAAQNDKYYGFLKEHDRYRTYGYELRDKFNRNPADCETAIRLLHYSNYNSDSAPGVFVRLEKARAARHIRWTSDEMLTVTRLLLAGGYGDAASRFLYTLVLDGEMKRSSPLRAKVLYQLFEVLSDAADERLSLTRGDLRFFQDIAAADKNPGMLGGILSLVLSDTNPKAQLATEESRAVAHFNRAAAYRIFLAYRQEYPTAPELAQMYLDIVRLYEACKDTETAAKTLHEFEERYADAPRYAEVALKLADCYAALGNSEAERKVYQQVLDYLGRHRRIGVPLVASSTKTPGDNSQAQALSVDAEPTTVSPAIRNPITNQGINIPASEQSSDRSESTSYSDHLEDVSTDSTADDNDDAVDYETVLARYVASLDKDKRTADILALYASEIKKYGDEQGLYEQLLQWLGQTNMVDEQLRVYQEAINSFPSMMWRDRLARWYIRQKRNQDFQKLSRDLISTLDDAAVENYLHKFVDGNVNASPSTFDATLYLSLYSVAHQRFPHNLSVVNGLLKYYSAHQLWSQWRLLVAEYYFTSADVRAQFILHLASKRELRGYLDKARTACSQSVADNNTLLPYKLFRADAAAWLSNYEEAVDAYREMNRLYPNSPEFAERLISFARSLGQHSRRFLEESADTSRQLADSAPASAEYRTRAGEIQAELGDYAKARGEWEQLVPLGRGNQDSYLDTATVYWDYFQYDDALRTINALRQRRNNDKLYSFQAAVIFEDKHQLPAALTEYVKALDVDEEGFDQDSASAVRRLVQLSKRPGVYSQIEAAFTNDQRHGTSDGLIRNYVDFLSEAEHWAEASTLLRRQIAGSDSESFLKHARSLFEEKEETVEELEALNRLAITAASPRAAISYRLQMAAVHEHAGERAGAAATLRDLIQRNPTNLGVLTECADFYWRMGMRSASLAVLETGMRHGIGRFHYLFGRKLAAHQVEMNQVAAAQRVLEELHREDRLNTEVFHELAKLYVRTGNQQALRTNFQATVEAIKKQDTDIREIRDQVAQFREEMIDAFTRLKDYSSAVEQHIEIINRNPEDESKVDAAINYVQRYGGADTLLTYYQRTSQQAFRNYRWNVVLARIYDAKHDYPNATREYRAAIDNQPEMTELYDSLADVYARAKDYNAALAALRKASELSNDDPQFINRIIQVLEKAGRHREAEAERRKLPQRPETRLSVREQFAAAARMRGSDRDKAIEQYRKAFDQFAADPLKNDIETADIVGYVKAVRQVENLDLIATRLWQLRTRIATETQRSNSTDAGKAKELLAKIDGALPDAVGGLAAEKATGEELTQLFKFLQSEIDASLAHGGDNSDTLSLLREVSRRAGLGSLEERVLIAVKDHSYTNRDWPTYHTRLQQLIDFYHQRGAYQRVIEILESERARDQQQNVFEYARLLADESRLMGDTTRELQALRENYQKPVPNSSLVTGSDPLIDRYFELLVSQGSAGRNELITCANQGSVHQLQLINFLLRSGEKEFAHTAIDNSPLSYAWKLSRNAEASLELKEFSTSNEQFFVDALQFQPIGSLIKQKADLERQLTGDDWFRLAQTYGRWLHATNQRSKSYALLPSLIEDRPQDIKEQARLGHWYLEQKDVFAAIRQLELAHDADRNNSAILADLGSAYFLAGNKTKANETWDQILGEEPSSSHCELYLQTLAKHNQSEHAHERVAPFVTDWLESKFQSEDSGGSSEDRNAFQSLIRTIAKSFSDSAKSKPTAAERKAMAAYFNELSNSALKNRFLPGFVIREGLVPRSEFGPFYQLLINRSAGLTSYDHDYAYNGLRTQVFAESEIEDALDQETGYKPSGPGSERIKWQQEYIGYLLEQHRDREARLLVATIEREIKNRYARPAWLRLAAIRLEVRAGHLSTVMPILEHFVGVRTRENGNEIKPPSTERLNDAVALLRAEQHEQEADSLLEAAYARSLALNSFEPSYFAGLARLGFEHGDAVAGLQWLQRLVDLTDSERNAETTAAVAALPLVKAHAAQSQPAETEGVGSSIDKVQALRLAAETAAEFDQLNSATSYRQQLLIAQPEDEVNRIELVRLLAAGKQTTDAIQNLAQLIGDRETSPSIRWQAIWLSREIAGKDTGLWQALRDQVRGANAKDSEVDVALESLSAAATGRLDDAVKLIGSAEPTNPNPALISLRAVLEKERGSSNEAISSFARALAAASTAQTWEPFSFVESEPQLQMVSLYLKQDRPRAALRLFESVAPASSSEAEGIVSKKLMLTERARLRSRNDHIAILEQLSIAAERLGDLRQAHDLEEKRLALLSSESERRASQARLERLQNLQTDNRNGGKPSLAVDQKLVAAA